MVSSLLAPAWLSVPDDPNVLQPNLWASSVVRAMDGELTVGGVPVVELANRFGTPLYVVDEEDVRARAAHVREVCERACEKHGTTAVVYYAGKAFLSTDFARWMVEAGLNIDVCTGGELAVVGAAGVSADRVGFHGNNKSEAEIDQAVFLGVGTIVLDSVVEVERVARAAQKYEVVQKVRLRVNSGVHASTHEFLATAHEDQKFGVTRDDSPTVVAMIRSYESLQFVGLHCHIGSQIFDAQGFVESAARLLTLHRDLCTEENAELNLGGGFGVAYTVADDPTPIDEMVETVVGGVARECARLGIAVPRLVFEPGRVIVGPSTFTLYEVGTVKDVVVDGMVRRYVSVNGGMSDNARPALYGAEFSVRLASRVSTAPPQLVRIAGKHCESGDIIVNADYLPADVRPGDLVAVPVTGAYCWSLSSNYNYVGRPPVVAVQNGEVRLLIRGETEHDLLARDMGSRSQMGPPQPH